MKKLLSLSLVFVTISCAAQWGKKIKGNGNVVTIERNVGDYDAISVAGWYDVDLVEGKEGKLTLEGESNLLTHIKTEVKNGRLVIKIENGCNLKPASPRNTIKITVPVEDISSISLSGSGDIVGKTTIKADDFKTSMSGSGDITLAIEADAINTSMSGSGDIKLSGRTNSFEARVSGSGDIKAYTLEADHVEATVSGSADIKITANKSLKARVSGSGDISYRGNPDKVDTKSSGSGDISKA